MLKWAKQTQRRASECSDLETCSNLSSDSSESGITVPIRYHERRASRPKSLALSSSDVLDLDHEPMFISRRPQRTGSSPVGLYSGCSRSNSNRHSMIVLSRDTPKIYTSDSSSIANNNNDVLKISTTVSHDETDTGVLKISTTDSDKPKSRNSFWKNLRAKAQGKKTNRKLEKSHSMSNIPDMSAQRDITPTNNNSRTPTNEDTTNSLISNTCPSPIVMRRQQKPIADSVSPTRTRANVMRRRSFKLIKKQNENKKPKPFLKASDLPASETDYCCAGSPDSGISSVRHLSVSNTDSDYDSRSSPVSPITPIDIVCSDGSDISHLKQQFTSAVLQYLNERLEKKGYNTTIMDRSSSTSSTQSDDGAPDIFCYDTDTVARRPSHRVSPKQAVELATH